MNAFLVIGAFTHELYECVWGERHAVFERTSGVYDRYPLELQGTTTIGCDAIGPSRQ